MQLLTKLGEYVLVWGMVLSVPALIFAAFYFDNGNLLYWILVPVIFFMAG